MPIKTFYLLNTAATAPDWFGNMQDSGSAPAAASCSYGWTVAKQSVSTLGYYRARLGASTNATAGQSASTLDDPGIIPPRVGTGATNTTAGDSFSVGPFFGTFPAGNWTFNWQFRTAAATTVGFLRMSVWRSTSDTGAGATMLAGPLTGATVTMNSTTASFNSSITWNAPAITLNNEYLFFQVEWKETVAGTSNSCSAVFRQGESSIVTTNFNANIQFVASNLAIAALAIDTEILIQSHVLGTSAPTIAGSPVFGDLVFTQVSPIDSIPAATAAVAGSPAFGVAVISEIPNFVPPAFAVAALALGVGVLDQQHVLPAPLNAVAGVRSFTNPALTQSNILAAINVAAGAPSLAAASMGVQVGVIAANLTTVAPIFGKPTLVSGLKEVLLDAYVIDNGLRALNTADQMLLCAAQPNNYANAIATKLATKALGTGNVFGLPTAAADGRKCTSAPISNGVVDADGDAICWVAVNAAGAQLLVSGLIDITAVATNSSWAMTPVAVHLPSGA